MTIEEAIDLIRGGVPDAAGSIHWADLGCGSGTFTNALATLLGKGNRVLAFDLESTLIVKNNPAAALIEFHQLDFVQQNLPVAKLDGILMANAFHYVKEKLPFIEKLKAALSRSGRIILVEYDTEKPNQWVPYPISFSRTVELFSSSGFRSVTKIGERTSVYRSGMMYASLIL